MIIAEYLRDKNYLQIILHYFIKYDDYGIYVFYVKTMQERGYRMKSDIEIAQEAKLIHIREIAKQLGIAEDDLEFYGKYKAKISDELWEQVKDREDGKLVLVTAINPTPAGEGKTTTSVGIGQAMAKLGKKAAIALREPSLGPCFGIKGGAAGGGYAQVVPMEDLNLHFTGDFHAITSANNLLAAMLDNHIKQGNKLGIDTNQIVWKRCMDMNDRVLRNIVVGLGRPVDGVVREDHFIISVASEIMAILCLADNMKDLKDRLGRMIVAYNYEGKPVTAAELNAVGAMAALLKDAMLQGKDISKIDTIASHKNWADMIMNKYDITADNCEEILQKEIGIVFTSILEQCGVYSRDEKGKKDLIKFIESVK